MFAARRLCLLVLPLAMFSSTLRGEEARPIFVVQFSEGILNRMMDQEIVRDSKVNDEIMGSHVVGSARTIGKPKMQLIDSEAGPTINVIYSGVTLSRTAGHHFPVVIHSRTRTDFNVARLVAVEQKDAMLRYPTRVESTTSVVTDDITTHRRGPLGRITLNRAWPRVAAAKPQAEAIAAAKAREGLVKAFDDALEPSMEKFRERISLRQLAGVLLPSDATPAYRALTKDGYLTVAVFAKEPAEKIVMIELPKLAVPQQPVQVWLHSSTSGDPEQLLTDTVDKARGWLALSLTVVALGSNEKQKPSELRWATADNWVVVQLAETEKYANVP